ncbi:non-ribosomal peptide synthetase [Thermoactinospora rubra]|uniref:non-ribosomal peptide synthetase n=1 Tax=Thermoactinospora rubra TaxID=1088767 RepID=UPI000A121272|nr:non-ribosomal peptide synthetase [Thermoactinospora rubra]
MPPTEPPAEYLFPVSPAQARLLVLDRMHPGSAQYNVPVGFAVHGPLDLAAFRRALDEVVARHESLRTVFRPHEGEYLQVVAASSAACVEVAAPVPAAEAAALMAEEAARPFDVEKGPLLRCTVYPVDEGGHRILLVAHHLVCDGWSLQVLLRELGAAYRGEPLAPLPIQYADYAAWQRERPTGEAVRYWVETLRGAPSTLALPTSGPRPAVQSTAGAAERFPIPAATRERLARVARQSRATPFMAMLAAFAVFLGRVCGQRDLVLGVPVSGRDHPDAQGLIGLLTNTLAVRVDLSGEPTFRTLLERVRDRLLESHPYHDAPFEAVVEAVAPGRELSHDPLVQVMVGYDDDTVLDLDLAGARVERVEVPLAAAKFDLLLYVERWGEELVAQLIHRTDLLAPATVRHWARAFRTLLDGLLDAPDVPAEHVDLLPARDRELIVRTWNSGGFGTGGGYGELVPDLVARRAAERPDAVAVVFGETVLTYRELMERADGLAERLRRAGVGPETPVGLLLPRSADMAVCALAVLRAGGAYVPLDPGHPVARLASMVRDAEVPLLLANAGSREVAARLGVPVALADAASAGTREVPRIGDPVESRPGPANLAYILYTSGSTGAPKGVAVEHRALLNLATAVRRQFPVTAKDRVLQFVSFGFDVAVSDLFFSWVAGAELHIAAECERLGEELLAKFRDSRITYAFLPPSAAMSMPVGELPELRTLAIGGEPCPAELVERWWRPGRRIVDAYGPSEATVYSTIALLEPGRPVVIGRPVAGARAYVLDERLRPVPVGVAGEIYMAGAGLARGYAGQPGLTAERFVADPYGPPGSRMYRTGDLGSYDADGVISYLGRIDTQVKIRGFRVELGEIETVLAAHPAVAVAAAKVAGAGDDRRLLAYAVPARGERAEPRELRAWLADRLPGYMVPDVVVPLEELPVNRSGKVDRARLPEPGVGRPDLAEPYRAPDSPAQRRLAEVWGEVLGLERVGVDDNFFDLGGTSIRLLAVLARLRELGYADVGLVDLFRHPTVAALADRLEGKAAEPDHGESRRRGELRRDRLAARRHRSSH